MIDRELLNVLEDAIASPEDHCEGDGKDRLRAAFDAVSSQVFAGIFGHEPPSRANARLTLNSAKREDYSDEMWNLIQRLAFAIGEAENSLHRRDYSEHKGLIEEFIGGALKPLVEVLK